MTKKTQRERVDRAGAAGYAGAGAEFRKAADLACSHGYWNAAGLLLVHAAIAAADAVCIALAGWKSTSDSYFDAVTLLGECAVRVEDRSPAMTHLKKISDEKNRVAYTGQSFRAADVERLSLHTDRFLAWAGKLLAE